MGVEQLAEETASVPEHVAYASHFIIVKGGGWINNDGLQTIKTPHMRANRLAGEKDFDAIVQG